jgi:hypothetical protein
MNWHTKACTIIDLNPTFVQVVHEVSEDLDSSQEEVLFCYETTTRERDRGMALIVTKSEIILISHYDGATSFKTVLMSEVRGFDDTRGVDAPAIFRVFAGDSATVIFDCESKQIVREVERKF